MDVAQSMNLGYAFQGTGAASWVPVYGCPTVCLIKRAEHLRFNGKNALQRAIFARAVCTFAVAMSALEAFGHATAGAGMFCGIGTRVVVRTVNRLLSGLVFATWGFVYGGALSFNIADWIRGIIFNVYLFGRGFSMAGRHWLERGVAAGDLAWLGVICWDSTAKVDKILRTTFNMTKARFHMGASWNFAAFAGANLFASILHPEKLFDSCKHKELGRPMPPRVYSLQGRIWNQVKRHPWWTLTILLSVALVVDYAYYSYSPDTQYLKNYVEMCPAWLDKFKVDKDCVSAECIQRLEMYKEKERDCNSKEQQLRNHRPESRDLSVYLKELLPRVAGTLSMPFIYAMGVLGVLRDGASHLGKVAYHFEKLAPLAEEYFKKGGGLGSNLEGFTKDEVANLLRLALAMQKLNPAGPPFNQTNSTNSNGDN